MSRGKDPVILTGPAALWISGAHLPAQEMDLPHLIMEAIMDGRLQVGGRGVVAVMTGQGVAESDAQTVQAVELPGYGLPVGRTTGVVAVGRLAGGVQGDLAVFGATVREGRRWIASFGADVYRVALQLQLGAPDRTFPCVFFPCTQGNKAAVKKQLWDRLKGVR